MEMPSFIKQYLKFYEVGIKYKKTFRKVQNASIHFKNILK